MLVEKVIHWGARMYCNRHLSLVFVLYGDLQVMGTLKLKSKFRSPVHMAVIYKRNHRRFNLWIFFVEVNRVAKFHASIGADR